MLRARMQKVSSCKITDAPLMEEVSQKRIKDLRTPLYVSMRGYAGPILYRHPPEAVGCCAEDHLADKSRQEVDDNRRSSVERQRTEHTSNECDCRRLACKNIGALPAPWRVLLPRMPRNAQMLPLDDARKRR